MAIMFNTLLEAAGVDPSSVRLLRHQDARADRDRTPYRLWRDFPDDFMTYQSRQSPKSAKELGRASHWAVFVVTPSDEQVSILEVAGSGASDNDILVAEQLWINKLQSRAMGLNN